MKRKGKPISTKRHFRELKPCIKCGARLLEACKGNGKCPGMVPL